MPDGRARGAPGVGRDRWHFIGAAGEPLFQNGWVNYGTGGTVDASYRKENGVVWLQGTVKNGSSAAIFTLPPGYRPALVPGGPTGVADQLIFAVMNTGACRRVDVYPGGQVNANGGTGTYLSLDGIRYLAED